MERVSLAAGFPDGHDAGLTRPNPCGFYLLDVKRDRTDEIDNLTVHVRGESLFVRVREQRPHNVGVASAECSITNDVARSAGGNGVHCVAQRGVSAFVVAVMEEPIS